MQNVEYAIDRDDLIVAVNAGWDEFAQHNDGEQVLAPQVLGRRLWKFIHDDLTSHLYRTMVQRLRADGVPLQFDFRCDSPDRRRLLHMQMTLTDENGVRFQVGPVHEAPRLLVPLLAKRTAAKGALVTVCSWCARVRLPTGEWVWAEQAMEWFGRHDAGAGSPLTHGICPECYQAVEDELTSPAPGDRQPVTLGDFREP